MNLADAHVEDGDLHVLSRAHLHRPVPAKRTFDYGVRAPVFYGKLREQTGENGFPRIPTGILFLLLQKSPNISGNLREFMRECNLGIPYSSYLLGKGGLVNTPSGQKQIYNAVSKGSVELFQRGRKPCKHVCV